MGYLGKGPTRIPGKLYDSNGNAGTSGYVLSSTATGIQWISSPSGSSTFLNLTDTPGAFTADKFLAVNSTGTAIEFVDAPSGGGGGSTGMDITLGTPTDGSLSDNNALASFDTSTKVTDAIDDINEILGKLAPAKPPNLSTKTLSLISSYSATESSSGNVQSNVTDDTTPRTSTVEEFWDGESGTLTANVNGSADGSITLTTSDDSATNSSLTIANDFGYPTSGTGAGFWSALNAYIESSSVLSLGQNTYQMKHSDTGDTNLFTFYVDDPTSVTITSTSFDVSGKNSDYISGVPSIRSGEGINVSFTINDAIKTFYNTPKVATVSGTSILSTSIDHQITGPQTYNDTINVSTAPSEGSLTVGSNKYSETNTLSIQGFNSKGTGGTSASLTLTNVRVDTKSNESGRIFAGSGEYPTTYATGGWDSAQNLISNADYDEELQLVGGVYKRPSGNYTSNSPATGPDYNSDTQTDYRYVLFNTGTISNVTSVTLTLNNATGITNLEQSGIRLQVKVDGANPTTGWIDANSSYSAGNPTNNGDPALDFGGSSSATSRRITFGSAVKSGTVYVRFGLPTGSTKSLGSITKS